MNPTKALLTGTAAMVCGILGTLLAGGSVFVPAPWGFVVALLGFVLSTLAGAAATPPKFLEGKPILQGAALTTIGTAIWQLLETAMPIIPAGWPMGLATAGLSLLGWLLGRSVPALGSTLPTATVQVPASAFVTEKSPVEVFNAKD